MKRFLSIQLSVILFICACLCVPVSAAKKKTDGRFYYELSKDGKYYSIVDCESSLTGVITIPKKYEGLPVRVIDHGAFQSCSKITSVKIGSNIKTIKGYAFNNCDNLSEIRLSDHIKYIDSTSFKNTKYYDDPMNWVSGVLYIGNHLIKAEKSISGNYRIRPGTETIASSAFLECSSLKAVVIPETVYSIPDYAFRCCSKLTHIYIPEGVTSIGEESFDGCINLESVYIPSTVKSLGECSIPSNNGIYIPENITSFGLWAVVGTGPIYGVAGSEAQEYAEFDEKQFIDIATHSHKTTWVEHSTASKKTCGIRYKKCDECGFILSYKVTNQLKPGKVKIKNISNDQWRVMLKWNSIYGADQYRIYRKLNGAKSWEFLGVTSENVYLDYTVRNNKHYQYTVRAQNEAGLGDYNKAGVKIKYVDIPIIEKYVNTDSGVKLTWGRVKGADRYYIYRWAEDERDLKLIKKITDPTVVSFLDKDVRTGIRYYYGMRAGNGSNLSGKQALAELIGIVHLESPKLKSIKSTKNGVKITWNKVKGADEYIVYRKTGTGKWKLIAKVEGGETISYLDKKTQKGKTYTYTVKASSCGYFTSTYDKQGLTIKDLY